MRTRGWVVLALATAAVLLLCGRAITSLVVEHAWFTAMGVPALWWERVVDSVLLQGGAGVVGALFAFANLHAVRRTILAVAVPSRVANIELTAMIPGRRLLGMTIVLSALIGLGLAVPLTDWTDVAMARHGVPFGEIEGILGRDLGFYVYWLPLEETLYVWALVTVISVGTVVIILYALTRSLRLDGRRVLASSHARRHLSALGALVLLILSWSYRLDGFDVLRNGSGPDGLFLRVDHIVLLRVDLLMSVLSGMGALLLLRAGWMSQLRFAFITLSVVLAGAIGLRHILPAVVARGTLLGDPARRDLDYLDTRTLISRRAYDVDGIRITAPESIPAIATRVRRSDLTRSVSLWDASTLQAPAADDARPSAMPARASWVSTERGLAGLVVRRPGNVVSAWSADVVDATAPVVRDSSIEFTVAPGDTDGPHEPAVAPGLTGHRLMHDPSSAVLGTSLQSFGLRVAHAWAARDPDLLRTRADEESNSVFVSLRDVRERVSRLAPVFAQGGDVLPLVYEGALYWTLQLYSASSEYPLSQHWQLAGEVRSYFRLAATALVEANSGRVRLIAVDRPDPVARTWMARVPSLFVRTMELPSGMVRLLPPATDGAIAQLRTFARYGSRLQGTVPRHLPDSIFQGDGPPGHLVQTDSGDIVAWSVALLETGEQIGGVISAVGGRYRRTFWDSTTVPRPRWTTGTEQLGAALDSARALVADGSRRESRLRPGRVQAIMSDRGPVLVQPLQWNRGDGTTVISRVAVHDDGRVGVGGTLAEAVEVLGWPRSQARPIAGAIAVSSEPRDVAVDRLYEVMRQALRSGNWTRFGAAFDSLGKVLGRAPE